MNIFDHFERFGVIIGAISSAISGAIISALGGFLVAMLKTAMAKNR